MLQNAADAADGPRARAKRRPGRHRLPYKAKAHLLPRAQAPKQHWASSAEAIFAAFSLAAAAAIYLIPRDMNHQVGATYCV